MPDKRIIGQVESWYHATRPGKATYRVPAPWVVPKQLLFSSVGWGVRLLTVG
jgi:hypothetical protein